MTPRLSEERRAELLDTQLEEDVKLKTLQRRTELVKVGLATAAVLAAIVQTGFRIVVG